jgi:hypothetical protein
MSPNLNAVSLDPNPIGTACHEGEKEGVGAIPLSVFWLSVLE